MCHSSHTAGAESKRCRLLLLLRLQQRVSRLYCRRTRDRIGAIERLR